jgi:hypothetical protein
VWAFLIIINKKKNHLFLYFGASRICELLELGDARREEDIWNISQRKIEEHLSNFTIALGKTGARHTNLK